MWDELIDSGKSLIHASSSGISFDDHLREFSSRLATAFSSPEELNGVAAEMVEAASNPVLVSKAIATWTGIVSDPVQSNIYRTELMKATSDPKNVLILAKALSEASSPAVVEQQQHSASPTSHDVHIVELEPGSPEATDLSDMTVVSVHQLSPEGHFIHSIRYWQKGKVLGRGSFGTVHEAYTDVGFFFAVKEVGIMQGQQSISQLEQEISFLSQFVHENIVRYLGTDKDKTCFYIFLELVTKGSLRSLYQEYTLQDYQVSAYTKQILAGVAYLHAMKVVHRDIKCANILIDVNGSVKLADFGLAKISNLNDINSCKGTAHWMAPEVVRSTSYGIAADIWSIGCTVLEMLTRRIPYSDFEVVQAMYRIGSGIRPSVPSSLSTDAKDFISKCLQAEPEKRPTAAELLEHPFVKSRELESTPASSLYNTKKT